MVRYDMASIPATVLILFFSVSAAYASTIRCPRYLTAHGVMAHPYDVTKYYQCHDSRFLVEMQCSAGTEFNSQRLICMKSAAVAQQKNAEATDCPTTTPCPCPTDPPCPTTTTRDPNGPTTTTKDPNGPTTTTKDPNGPTTTTRDPNGPTTTTKDPNGPPQTTTTRCPEDECKDGERETSPGIPSVTPSPPDSCETGEQDVTRPIVTTLLPC